MNKPTDIQAAFFDMDGLLLDTERISMVCWDLAAKEFGFSLPQEIFSKMIGKPVAENESLVCSAIGEDFPYWEVRARREAIMEAKIAAEGIPVKQGVLELIAAFKSDGINVAVVTSTQREEAIKRLEQADLLSEFEFIVGPEDCLHGKPQPDCYLVASSKIGIDPNYCLVLEDSPAGVKAGSAAGMWVCWVPDLVEVSPELEELAHFHCRDLKQARREFVECSLISQ